MSGMPGALVVHPGALGDVLLAAPALAHLQELGLPPTLAVASHLVGLWRHSGLVERAVDLESLGLHRLFAAPSGASEALDGLSRYRTIVSWLGAGDPGYRASLGRLPVPVVIARATPPADRPIHASRHLLETLAPLGPVPTTPPAVRLAVAPAERAEAHRWLAAERVRPEAAVVLQAGAGSRAKAWPGFPPLAARLRAVGLRPVVVAGAADAAVLDAMKAGGAPGDTPVARDWPLPRIAALLALARATVGNDSGPTHLAALVGCPTVALFGPTDPARWAPLGPRVRVIAGAGPEGPWTHVTLDRILAVLDEVAAPVAGRGPIGVPA